MLIRQATLRSHGIVEHDRAQPGEHSLIAEVKLAAVATGRTFALVPPGWADRKRLFRCLVV